MRGWVIALLLSAATLLGACGGPANQGTANQAGTAVASTDLESAAEDAATAVSDPETEGAIEEAIGELSAVIDNTTLIQGEQLVLDASNSLGEIKEFQWTIQDAPQGAEAVEGTTIAKGSSSTVSLEPEQYEKYFPTAGTYTVRLTITDAAGNTSHDDFQVEVP